MDTYVRIPYKHICYTVVYIFQFIFFVYEFSYINIQRNTYFFAIHNFLITVFYPWQSILPGTYHTSILLAISLVLPTNLGTFKGSKERKLAFTYSPPNPNLPHIFFSHPRSSLISHRQHLIGEKLHLQGVRTFFFSSKSVPSPRNMLKRNAMPRNHYHLTCCVGR